MKEAPTFDKEAIYDEKIAPLMTQVIAICKEHGIPCLCSFLYRHSDSTGDGDDHYCTTLLNDGNGWNSKALMKACDAIRSGGAQFAAFTVTTP